MDAPSIKDHGIPWSQNAFVVRGPQDVLDTLSWEGYDDARYLATLEDALTKAETTGKHTTLVARTRRWLDNLSIHTDLDDWRFEMARRTTALRR